VLVGFSSIEQLEQALALSERGALAEEYVQRVVDVAGGEH